MAKWLEEKTINYDWDDPVPPKCEKCSGKALAWRKTPFCPWCGEPMELEKEEK